MTYSDTGILNNVMENILHQNEEVHHSKRRYRGFKAGEKQRE